MEKIKTITKQIGQDRMEFIGAFNDSFTGIMVTNRVGKSADNLTFIVDDMELIQGDGDFLQELHKAFPEKDTLDHYALIDSIKSQMADWG